MATKNYYRIRYTDSYTGERKNYMNIGFESKEDAEYELRKIKREIKKMKGLGYYLKRPDNQKFYYVTQVGKNFRITKTKNGSKLKTKVKNWCRYWHYNVIGVIRDNQGHRNYLTLTGYLDEWFNEDIFKEGLDLNDSWKKVLSCLNKCDLKQLYTIEKFCTSKEY